MSAITESKFVTLLFSAATAVRETVAAGIDGPGSDAPSILAALLFDALNTDDDTLRLGSADFEILDYIARACLARDAQSLCKYRPMCIVLGMRAYGEQWNGKSFIKRIKNISGHIGGDFDGITVSTARAIRKCERAVRMLVVAQGGVNMTVRPDDITVRAATEAIAAAFAPIAARECVVLDPEARTKVLHDFAEIVADARMDGAYARMLKASRLNNVYITAPCIEFATRCILARVDAIAAQVAKDMPRV